MIDYGNGVSIDTDDVTYIENGPNYYTYTFNIKRENAPADAPIENLVLSPLTDGTYREILVTYNLTAQEKQMLENGIPVDLTGKVTHETLQSGTYSSEIMRVESCQWEINSYYTTCSGTDRHHNGELPKSEGGPCNAESPSILVVALVEKCTIALPVNTGLGDDGEGGGSGPGTSSPGGLGNGEDDGSGNNEFPSNEPGDCGGGLTAPQTPSYDISDGGCGNGIPTQPTFPSLGDDPCRKTRASIDAANNVLKNPDVQTKMDAKLKEKISAPIEYAIAIGTKDGAYDVTAANPGEAHSSVAPVSWLSNGSTFFADGHTHSGDPANPSAGDLYGMLEEIIKPNSNFAYRFVYGTSNNIDEVYALVLNDKAAAIAFLDTYPRAKNYDPVTHDFLKGSELSKKIEKMKVIFNNKSTAIDTSGENYNSPSIGLAYMLENLKSGISIAKVDANGNLKKLNVATEKIGNDERVKISKCP